MKDTFDFNYSQFLDTPNGIVPDDKSGTFPISKILKLFGIIIFTHYILDGM